MKHSHTLSAILLALLAPLVAVAAESETGVAAAAQPDDTRALDEEIQSIKKEAVELNRDLFVLEEELLFPANTQVAVFLSMDVGEFFALDTVELRVDDKQVAKHLYTPREAEALPRRDRSWLDCRWRSRACEVKISAADNHPTAARLKAR